MSETVREPYRNSKPGEAWNAAYSSKRDEHRCRWPDCQCYSPQGPHECARPRPTGGQG